jgi:hypothetical protein
MNFDGFLYVFAFIGIVTTAVAASLGIALILTMARFTYVRFKVVGPLLFPPSEILKIAQQRGITRDDLANEPVAKYTEKIRMPAATNDGRKGQAMTETDLAVPG